MDASHLRILEPCHESWDAMSPAEHGRHCAACEQIVFDLTALPPVECERMMTALAARAASGERICVRAHAGADGRLRATRNRRRLLTNGMAAMLAVAIAGAEGCAPQSAAGAGTQTQRPYVSGMTSPDRASMGDVCDPQSIQGRIPWPSPMLVTGAWAPPRPVAPSMGGIQAVPERSVTPVDALVPTEND